MPKSLRIAVIGGDGTGPEVTAEAVKVLKAVAPLEGLAPELVHYDLGGARYLRTGEILPPAVVEELRRCDAIFLGAVGHPDVKPGILEKGLLLELRFQLDLYINLRPVKLYPGVETPLRDKGPADIDFVVVRENTEDMYCGAGGFLQKGTQSEVAVQTAIYTRKGCERCIRWAFDYTRRRNNPKKTLTLVAKTNVLTFGHDLWWRAFQDVAREFPDVKTDYNHVDACCMWMVKSPEAYDVIVTTNMFGDIITDLGAILQGGLGVAAGANMNPDTKVGMFEPMGGSAPKYTGKNAINPIAAIGAMGMLLEHTGHAAAAERVLKAIQHVTGTKMKSQAAGKMGYGTREVGNLVAGAL
ncbi:MAG: 3-isopropylmalate dehydrogenase [Planctomycetia bacterium]|nr:3-isopropylmalate dehydrogenase [Planctomycetia bacterium]